MTYSNNILTVGLVLLSTLLMFSLNYPFVSLFLALIFLISVYFIITKTDPIPILSLLVLIFISSFNLGKPSYIIVICLALLSLFYSMLKNNCLVKSAYSRYYMFFYIWVIFATIQVIYQNRFLLSSNQYQSLILGILIIWLMSKFVIEKTQLKRVYLIWGMYLLITIIIGWWEVLTGNHIRQTTAYPHLSVATVGFFNQNDYSFFLAISLPIVFFWIKGKIIYKCIGFFMLGSIFSFVFINGSRLILIIIIFILGLFLIQLFKFRNIGLIIIFVLSISLLALFNMEAISATFDKLSTVNSNDYSVNSRKQLTEDGFRIFKENPLFGVGPGNLENHMPQKGDKVHNFWLEILVNYGILIFAGLVIFFANCLYVFKKTSNNLQRIVWPVFLSTIIFIPASLSSSSVLHFEVLWLFFGLMLSTKSIIKNERNYSKRQNECR
ncbi:O-antigen ligase family protein [Cerasibacillus sp. JNUCC 74]